MEQTSVDLCLLLALLYDGQSMSLAKIQRVNGGIKGYQAYKDSWAAVLGEKCHARGKATGLMFLKKSSEA